VAKDILQLVKEEEEQACRNRRRGLIICPGGIGDCLLTLPLAAFVKETCGLGGVDFVGHAEYIDFYPGRSCIDGIKSIDSIELHRLFADQEDFVIEDHDRLITSFARYECIVSFLGAGDANFETNLIFTVNCSHSAHITLLPHAAAEDFTGHISHFYIECFARESDLAVDARLCDLDKSLLTPHPGDVENGARILAAAGIDAGKTLVVIHPGSGGMAKCLHPAIFRRVAGLLRQSGKQVVFLLGPAEQERFSARTMADLRQAAPCLTGLNLTEVLQIMTHADCYVGNDSGISHIAGAAGTSTLVIFRPDPGGVIRAPGTPGADNVRQEGWFRAVSAGGGRGNTGSALSGYEELTGAGFWL